MPRSGDAAVGARRAALEKVLSDHICRGPNTWRQTYNIIASSFDFSFAKLERELLRVELVNNAGDSCLSPSFAPHWQERHVAHCQEGPYSFPPRNMTSS